MIVDKKSFQGNKTKLIFLKNSIFRKNSKFAAPAFEAGDFLHIFSRFWAF